MRVCRLISLALLMSVLPALSCATPQTTYPNFASIELREYGVALYYPSQWDLNLDGKRRLHLIARGFTSPGASASLEYRGIPQTQEDFVLYAEGWYNAMPANFDGFELVDRQKFTRDEGVIFHFEATFREAGEPRRVIGRLRARHGRVHAMYYIAPERDFPAYRDILEEMDSLHRTFKP